MKSLGRVLGDIHQEKIMEGACAHPFKARADEVKHNPQHGILRQSHTPVANVFGGVGGCAAGGLVG